MNVDALDRIESIRAQLQRDGTVRISALAAELDVSEMTIRRDLDLLVDEGTARRVRGGAVAIAPQEFNTRSREHPRAKGTIGQKLLALVPDHGAIALDASSTLQRMAARLGEARDLTVVTNGPETFAALQSHGGVTALLSGGQLDRRTGSLVGPLAVRAATDLFVSRLFVSAAAVDPELGSSEATLDDAEVKLAFAATAAEVILAVDTSKLGSRAPARTFPLERVTRLVTELDPGDPRLDPYREHCQIL
ncbi:MAG: DeoR/GlpR family DNA-binding transcription regulator [Actinomycetota bacterium]